MCYICLDDYIHNTQLYDSLHADGLSVIQSLYPLQPLGKGRHQHVMATVSPPALCVCVLRLGAGIQREPQCRPHSPVWTAAGYMIGGVDYVPLTV